MQLKLSAINLKNMWKKYQQLNLPAKAALWFTACNIMLKGISLISSPLFTRLLSEEEYGKVSVILSYQQFVVILSTWELALGGYQKGIYKYKKESLPNFTSATIVLSNLLTVVFFGIVFLGKEYVYNYLQISPPIVMSMLVYMCVQPAYSAWLVRERAAYKYKTAVSATLTYSLINVIAPLIGILFVGKTADVYFVFLLLCASAFFLCFYLRKDTIKIFWIKWGEIRGYWSYLIKFQFPLVAHALSYHVLGQADRVMIANMVGNTQAGFYSIAYNLASCVSIFPNSLNQVLTPWRYEKMSQNEYSQIKKSTNYLLTLIAGVILMFVIVSPEILKILYTADYYESRWCIPPIAEGMFFVFLYSIFVNIESYFEETKYVMRMSMMCAVLNIVMNYFVLHKIGYIACGYTTLISYMVFSIGHGYFMNRIVKKNLVDVSLFDYKYILVLCLAVVILVAGITVVYDSILVRYAILLVMLIALWIKRKTVLLAMQMLTKKG